MKVSVKEINYIAKLANLKFTEEETDKIANEFSEILNHFNNINKEDLDGYKMYSFNDEPSKLRKDEVIVFESKEQLFRNVKEMVNKSIKIPKIVD